MLLLLSSIITLFLRCRKRGLDKALRARVNRAKARHVKLLEDVDEEDAAVERGKAEDVRARPPPLPIAASESTDFQSQFNHFFFARLDMWNRKFIA